MVNLFISKTQLHSFELQILIAIYLTIKYLLNNTKINFASSGLFY